VPYLIVDIVRFVGDYQPGIVACEFADADGLIHTIIDKAPLFTGNSLDWDSPYPQRGDAQCEVMKAFTDSTGRALVQITLARPYQLETTDGLTEHVVMAEAVQLTAPDA
jgi:hypothetical protein